MIRDASSQARKARVGLRPRVLRLAAATGLAAGVIAWAASPISSGSAGTKITLVTAIATGAMTIAQLLLAATVATDPDRFGWADRLAQQLVAFVLAPPWAELMTVAVLMLETLHRSRPWHTAVLAVALTGYLLAVHLAETDGPASSLRAQLPLIFAGGGLAALAIGVTAVPGLPGAGAAAALRIGAVVLAVVVAGLAVPAWISRGR